MTTHTGQCLCGAVKYRATGVKKSYAVCHCRMCQQWSGGPFCAASAEKVEFDGEENIKRYRSSEWAERGFCRNCGSNLFYRVLKSESYEMCVGSFDEPDFFEVSSEIFVDRKPQGYALAGDHPRLTEAETLKKYKFSS